ncbi:hypothetical protein ACJIZ3_003801 [Penstemon smallii]|uniref:Beta-amylase n=1 Tax=Penstemon smallii TaxID=265156 RepID=A0ABD3S0A8_9LAMI
MAIASPSAPSFSTFSFSCTSRAGSNQIRLFPKRFGLKPSHRVMTRLDVINAASDGELKYDLHHGQRNRRRKGALPVYVTLPADAVGPTAQTVRRRKALAQSFRALAAAGVEGVVMEVWWGLVEREFPRIYLWEGYLEIVLMARRFGLKVRAVMAFHQFGSGPDDPFWIPLPSWVLKEIEKDPNVTYSYRFGERNMEYLSLGYDILPILHGRSPIQAYTDFMRNFRDTFRSFLGSIITGIQVGLGPGGELRYPSFLGEFHFYDKYMLAYLNACAQDIGVREWSNHGPIGDINFTQNPEKSEFSETEGPWKSPYGEFFPKWYSEMLLLHGERICRAAETIFRGNEVNISGKVAAVSELLTYGSIRDGLLPIARMFGKYDFTISCSCFDLQYAEDFLKQLMFVANICDVPLEGENSSINLNDESFKQVIKMSKLCSDGGVIRSFSYNFVRMDRNLFEYRNWVRFTGFVRQMSVVNIFRSKLGFGGGCESTLSSTAAAAFGGAVLAY